MSDYNFRFSFRFYLKPVQRIIENFLNYGIQANNEIALTWFWYLTADLPSQVLTMMFYLDFRKRGLEHLV